MSENELEATPPDHADALRRAFSAALQGDIEAVSRLLAADVHWYGAGGDPSAGCTSRREALGWIRQAVARGISAEVLDVQAVDPERVLILLRRQSPTDHGEHAEPHAQIVTFRGHQVSEIVVYPSEDEALAAVRGL